MRSPHYGIIYQFLRFSLLHWILFFGKIHRLYLILTLCESFWFDFLEDRLCTHRNNYNFIQSHNIQLAYKVFQYICIPPCIQNKLLLKFCAIFKNFIFNQFQIRGKHYSEIYCFIRNLEFFNSMKPSFTPYDRNSRLGLKMLTVNPCNQFIIQNLIRWKINVQKQGLNQFYTYNLAIESVRKYPLPILCYEQMKTMQGFGKFFCTSVAKLIRNHYKRARLPTKQQKEADDKEHEQFLRREMKKMRNSMKKGNNNDETQQKLSDNQSQYSEFNDNFQSQFQDGEEQCEENQQQSSQNSDNSHASQKSNRSYKPKPGCEVFNILRAIGAIFNERSKDPAALANPKPISRAQINTQLYQWRMDKIRNWNKLSDKLKQSGYIKVDPKDDDFIFLTTKGKDYMAQMEEQCAKASQNTTNIIKIFRKQKVEQNSSADKLFLVVNTRGSFKPEESFVNKLSEQRYKIKQVQYELGSFIFMIDPKVLNYIVLRFKMQSVDKEEFYATLSRAKNSQCDNVFVIFEFPQQKNRKLPFSKEQLNNIQVNCRASGFKIQKFIGPLESIKFLHYITERLTEKIKHIKKGEEVFYIGTLDFYNQKNKKMLPIVLKQICRKFLKCIPCINRQTILGLTETYPCFKIIYDQMSRLSNNQQRIQFMNWLLTKYSPKKGISMLIVDLFYAESYELENIDVI